MAHSDKGNQHRHLRDRHASVGYSERERPDGDIYCRPCAADFIICGGVGAVEHMETAGTGDCGSKSKGREVREARSAGAGRIPKDCNGLGEKKNFD